MKTKGKEAVKKKTKRREKKRREKGPESNSGPPTRKPKLYH